MGRESRADQPNAGVSERRGGGRRARSVHRQCCCLEFRLEDALAFERAVPSARAVHPSDWCQCAWFHLLLLLLPPACLALPPTTPSTHSLPTPPCNSLHHVQMCGAAAVKQAGRRGSRSPPSPSGDRKGGRRGSPLFSALSRAGGGLQTSPVVSPPLTFGRRKQELPAPTHGSRAAGAYHGWTSVWIGVD